MSKGSYNIGNFHVPDYKITELLSNKLTWCEVGEIKSSFWIIILSEVALFSEETQ